MKIESAHFVIAAHSAKDFPSDGRPEVAFVGRSNVGKSSLLNRLLGRKALARISSTPGRTRSVNYFLVSERWHFVDLPGYGYAKASKADRKSWARLMDDYFRHASTVGGQVVQLVDGKVGATALDVQAYEYLVSLGADPLVVATKIDRVSRSRRASGLSGIREELQLPSDAILIPFSARTGEGAQELWREVAARLQPAR